MTCPICAAPTHETIALPGFIEGDQALRQCYTCGHAMLAVQHPQVCAYLSGDTEYSRRGVEWFLTFAAGKYRCALDFGCNDGHLLARINARRRIGVDLNAPPLEFETHSSLETVDAQPDLIVSRHTLEHLSDPLATLKALVAVAAPDAQFVIEVPCLDLLAEALRFDQVYNEHLQYFSIGSFHRLLRSAGLKVNLFATHRHPHSMIAWCAKGADREEHFAIPVLAERFDAFKTYALATGNILMLYPHRVAYGASAIFPVLLYHLGLQAAQLEAVLDDATAKQGTHFHGLRVRSPQTLGDAAVLITAPDSFDVIYRKLGGAAHVLSAVPVLAV